MANTSPTTLCPASWEQSPGKKTKVVEPKCALNLGALVSHPYPLGGTVLCSDLESPTWASFDIVAPSLLKVEMAFSHYCYIYQNFNYFLNRLRYSTSEFPLK